MSETNKKEYTEIDRLNDINLIQNNLFVDNNYYTRGLEDFIFNLKQRANSILMTKKQEYKESLYGFLIKDILDVSYKEIYNDSVKKRLEDEVKIERKRMEKVKLNSYMKNNAK